MKEDQLVERRHKEAVLAGLYDEYYDRIARYAFIHTSNRTEAEDIAGDVFLKALESLDSYKERGIPMQAWLFKIARNLVIDYLRKVKKRVTVPLEDVDIANTTNPAEQAEIRMHIEKLSKAFKQLTPAQQEVISLRFMSGLDSNEVASLMGKSSGAVREMQSAAVKVLRKLVYNNG